MISHETIWRPVKTVVSREIDGHMLLVVLGRNESTFLNPVGSALWSRLDGSTSETDLAADLAGAYGIPQDEAAEAVAALLESLRACSLIEPSRTEPSRTEPAGPTDRPDAGGSPQALAFPAEYDVPVVAPMESLQVMGGCSAADVFCEGSPGSV